MKALYGQEINFQNSKRIIIIQTCLVHSNLFFSFIFAVYLGRLYARITEMIYSLGGVYFFLLLESKIYRLETRELQSGDLVRSIFTNPSLTTKSPASSTGCQRNAGLQKKIFSSPVIYFLKKYI